MSKQKSSFMAFILAFLMLALIGIGIYFIVDNVNSKDTSTSERQEMSYIQEEYNVGDNVVYQFYAFTDVEYESVQYSINNGEKIAIVGAKTGESVDHLASSKKDAKYYVDTLSQMISTENMTAGYYNIVFYGINADGEAEQIGNPYLFKLLEVVAEE